MKPAFQACPRGVGIWPLAGEENASVMSKRRKKRRRSNSQPGGTPRKGASKRPAEGAAAKGRGAQKSGTRPGADTGAGTTASSSQAPVATKAAPEIAKSKRTPIVPWRDRVRRLRDQLRAFARNHYAAVLDSALIERFGNPPKAEHPADLGRVEEDLVCTPGSAGDARSILRVFADDGAQLEDTERAELLRWEQGRSRGVFLVQRASQDRIEVWDPLEGAGLTLHLLDRLSTARADALPRGSVLTTTFLPFAARVVAVGYLELFEDPRAKELFKEQVRSGGRSWHEAPPPAPKPRRGQGP